MENTVKVNFHCHSIFSDGNQTPELLAENLTTNGVRYASLTDHDHIEGLVRFQTAAKKLGLATLTGVEITTQFKGREAHLLGYGFDPDNGDLHQTLQSLRQTRKLEVHSIAETLHQAGTSNNHQMEFPLPANAASNGVLSIGEAIKLIHRAGGKAFLAHPFVLEPDIHKLDELIGELKSQDLDGIETLYSDFSLEDRRKLRSLAQKHNLLTSAGTDFHNSKPGKGESYGIDMPVEEWISFRNAVFDNLDLQEKINNPGDKKLEPYESAPASRSHHFKKRDFVLRIFLPTFIAIALFLSVFWIFILPSFERSLLEKKREMIQELANSASSILASYYLDEQAGRLTQQDAQNMAIEQIRNLRYGPEGKDYFWIQDIQPRMIMHPYRPDLEGQDLSGFTDARGVKIFVKFAALVQREGEGYIDYVWQWNDDPERLEPKESFVKGFAPWGWIIGTGIYTDDVMLEIARLEQNLVTTSLVVSGVIIVLLIFVLQQSLRIEKQRQEMVDNLKESTSRYQSLIEVTTEGTLLILENRCRYANPTFLNMVGYSASQLEFLELEELLPNEGENVFLWQLIKSDVQDVQEMGNFREGYLQQRNGGMIECLLALTPIQSAGETGLILLAKDIARQSCASNIGGIGLAAQTVQTGIFRALPARRGVFLDVNPAFRSLLNHIELAEPSQPALSDFFATSTEFKAFHDRLIAGEEIKEYNLHIGTKDGTALFLSLSAVMVRDGDDQPLYTSGIMQDITNKHKNEAEQEALIQKLQTSLLFLHEPISNLGRDVVLCKMDTTIQQLSRLMTDRKVTAALVTDEASTVIGIVTDHDLRARVLTEGFRSSMPVYEIMSSPIIKIKETALVYEALMRMEEKGVRHLAVESMDGDFVSIIDVKSLVLFQRYGPIVLSREISRAKTVEEVAQYCHRTPSLVKALLDSSSRTRNVTNMLSSVCDSASERLLKLGIEKLGPPPVAFAFLGMGSHGRKEQTLFTDQDNGIIYAHKESIDQDKVREYFLQLGNIVCEGLNAAGYASCIGQVMANNPRWCRSLPDWLHFFKDWINLAEPQEIISINIFFDFRTVYGEESLSNELRRNINEILRDQPAFMFQLAKNATSFKSPLRLHGNLYLGGGLSERTGELNLKDAIMPIISFARLYSFQHQINQTNTLDRIDELAAKGFFKQSTRDEITDAYDFLMQLRLKNQVEAYKAGLHIDNIILPARLSYIQQEMLKQALAQVAAVQKKISFDFMGAE